MNKISRTIKEGAAVFAIAALVLFAVLSVYPIKANANPSAYLRSEAVGNATGAATTSPKYMTAGTATTTIEFNSQKGNLFAMPSATLILGIRSSTTVTALFGTTTLSLRVEIADTVAGVCGPDWSLATSSTIQTTTTEQMGSSLIASTSMTFRLIAVTTPLPCVRALIGVNPGSSNNGAAWGQWIGTKEI